MSKSKFRQEVEKSFWGKRILAAKKRGEFTSKDIEDAADWPTCACGKLDKDIPRAEWGAPIDQELESLGCDFADAVDSDNFKNAMDVLENIQRRAGEVLYAAKQKKKLEKEIEELEEASEDASSKAEELQEKVYDLIDNYGV